MKIPSAKTFLLVGFAISIASMVVNTFVLSAIGSRLKGVNSEYYKLEEDLRRQVNELTQADLKFDVYRVMHYLAYSSPNAVATDAREDAKQILEGFLVKFYATANDISQVEVNRIAMDEAGDALVKLKKQLELIQSLQKSRDQTERLLLAAVLDKLSKEEPPPKSELAAKLREVGKYADAEKEAADGVDLVVKLFPVMQSLTRDLIASIERKQARLADLARERSELESRAGLATYAAISLQIFGLMFIFARDLLREVAKDQEQAKKPEKKGAKDEDGE